MDHLDRLGADARPLLRRVDDIISTAGAPPAHRIWQQLRALRLLTVDAVDAVTALRPADFGADTPALRSRATGYAELATELPAAQAWSGEAAVAYAAARSQLVAHLAGGAESLAERLEASADLADALVDWMRRSRSAVAAVLAEVLGSAEAVLLSAGDDHGAAGGAPLVAVPEVVAAADVAELVLRAVAGVYDEAAELLEGSADLTVAVPVPGRSPGSWP